MGDMAEGFRMMTEDRKKRHAEWYEKNKAALDAAGFKYTDKGEAFTTPLKATFYPSTGRWTYKGKTFRGGAEKFMKFCKQAEK